ALDGHQEVSLCPMSPDVINLRARAPFLTPQLHLQVFVAPSSHVMLSLTLHMGNTCQLVGGMLTAQQRLNEGTRWAAPRRQHLVPPGSYLPQFLTDFHET